MSDAFFNSSTSIRQLIATDTASGSSTTLSFSSIPSNFNHLVVYLMGQQTNDTFNDCTLQLNGDTGSNYDDVLWYQNGGGNPTTVTNEAQEFWGIGPLADGTSNPALMIAQFPFYTNTNWNKIAYITNGYNQQDGSNNRLTYGFFTWRSKSAITSMVFTSGGGNFVANTVAYLYGLD